GKRRIVVSVALVELGRLEPARNAVEPRGDRGGEGQVGIGVGAGDAVLHAEASSFTAEPEAARPVVPAGHDARARAPWRAGPPATGRTAPCRWFATPCRRRRTEPCAPSCPRATSAGGTTSRPPPCRTWP